MKRRGFFGALAALFGGAATAKGKPAGSFYYQWNGGKKSNDPRFPNGPPSYGCRAFLNGREVGLVTRMQTGPDGWIERLEKDADGKIAYQRVISPMGKDFSPDHSRGIAIPGAVPEKDRVVRHDRMPGGRILVHDFRVMKSILRGDVRLVITPPASPLPRQAAPPPARTTAEAARSPESA